MLAFTMPALAPSGRPAVQRKRLGWCLLAVLSAHLLLLAEPAQRAVAPANSMPRAVQVRLVSAAGLVPSTAGATGASSEHQASPVSTAAATLRSARPSTNQTRRGNGDDLVDYLPRTALSVAPKAREPVAIDYPFFDGEADHYVGEFDLFIDDTGSVTRVVTVTPHLPGILGGAVRAAFLSARFSPGEVNGHAVRSRMRIEVTFDSHREPAQ
jgi:hypothetical protein